MNPSTKLIRWSLIWTCGLLLTAVPAFAQLFSDSFNSPASSGNWHIAQDSGDGIPDYTVEFGFDYSTQQFISNGITNTIPPAPNGSGNSVGVKLTVNNNDDNPATSVVSLYAADRNFTDNYALKVDMWLNYNGPEYGGTGSTEWAAFGINHTATSVATWRGATQPSSGIWFAVCSEGGDTRDYRAYVGDALFGGPSLDLQAAGGGFLDRDGDGEPEVDIFINDSQPPSHPLKLMFPKPDFETAGIPSKRWVQLEVRQTTNEFGAYLYTWLINGYVIAEHSVNDSQIAGTVMLGYFDPFASIANPREENFVIYDNLRVVDLNGVAPLPVVGAVATIPNAAEPSTHGLVTVSRTGDTSSALPVSIRMAGTATRGADYVTQTNGVTFTGNAIVIPAGASSVDVSITVVDDAIGETAETAILVVEGNPGVYEVREAISATVTIEDDGDVPSASVVATKAFAYEPNAVNPGRISVNFASTSMSDVTVNYTVGGTAVSGTDYTTLPLSVVVPAGQTSAMIPIAPINNSLVDGDRTVIVTLAGGTGYTIGAPDSATVTIRDDDTLPTGTTLFTEGFESPASGSDWIVNPSTTTDSVATFGYDYSNDGIPSAPNSSGTTSGLKLEGNVTTGVFGGLSVSPAGQSFTGDYMLRFDMWINYNGPLPTGGAGSTEFAGGGVGTTGTVPEFAGTGNGIFVAVTGDGGLAADYRVYVAGALQSAASIYAAGSQNNTAPYYAIFGGDPAPDAQIAMDPIGQGGLTGAGNGGFAWRDMAIIKQGTQITWYMDNLLIATYDASAATLSTNISLLYWDPNAGVSPQPLFSFGVFDNVRVIQLAAATPAHITHITLINGGTQVQIDFTAAPGDSASAFRLYSAGTVNGTYAEDTGATITQEGAGSFRAVTAVSGSQQYYRIARPQ